MKHREPYSYRWPFDFYHCAHPSNAQSGGASLRVATSDQAIGE